MESLIKSKLATAGLDTGGRQIEVKLVTSTINSNEEGADVEAEPMSALAEAAGAGKDLNSDEFQQFQSMIYNLMVSYRLQKDL